MNSTSTISQATHQEEYHHLDTFCSDFDDDNNNNNNNNEGTSYNMDILMNNSNNNYHNNERQLVIDKQQRYIIVILLSICTILLYADQNLMAPNLTEIAKYFNFTNEERDIKLGGDIALAFYVLGAPASLLIGYLTDKYNRILLFTITIYIGEIACLLTYYIKTYKQLYICRAITGISVGGALPIIYSILSDIYTPNQRHTINSYVAIGTGLGISLGQGIAGFIAPIYNSWRIPFLIISIPALCCATLFFLLVHDPPRGGIETTAIIIQQQKQQQYKNSTSTRDDNDTSSDNDNDNWDEASNDKKSMIKIEMSPLGQFHYNNVEQQQRSNRNYNNNNMHHHNNCYNQNGDSTVTTNTINSIVDGDHSYSMDSKNNNNNNNRRNNNNKNNFHTNNSNNNNWYNNTNFILLLSTPTVILALLQGAPGCIPWGIVNTYLNDYLAIDCNLGVEYATFIVLLFGVGNFFGMLCSGYGGSILYSINIKYPSLFAGICAIIGCIPFYILLNYNNNKNNNNFIIIPISILSGLFSGITGPIIKATLQNVTIPNTRGLAFALFNTFDDFGR